MPSVLKTCLKNSMSMVINMWSHALLRSSNLMIYAMKNALINIIVYISIEKPV